MRAIKRVARVGQSAVIVALLASLLASGVQAKAWGNDREPDWNDAQCDDDEGTGNDWKCEGTSDGPSGETKGGGHGWGNDRVADFNDAQCDDDEGTGNDWKCEGTSK